MRNSSREHIIRDTDFKPEGNSNDPESRKDANNGTPTGSITEYDPTNTFPGGEPDGSQEGSSRAPRAGLAHELSHANDNDTGNNKGDVNADGIKQTEVRAVNLENRVRAKTGDAMRDSYQGKKISTSDLEYKNKKQ